MTTFIMRACIAILLTLSKELALSHSLELSEQLCLQHSLQHSF